MTHELVDVTLTGDATAWARNVFYTIREIGLNRKEKYS